MSLTSRSARLQFAVAVILGASCNAWGSGFALQEQSASRLGTAFAGTAAAADDASTIFYNPAGLAKLEEAEFSFVASGVYISSEFNNESSLPATLQPLGNEGGNAGGWNGIPAGYFAMPLSEALSFGIGFNVPFGLKTEYDDGWMGRFQAMKSEIQTYNVNPSLAWQVNDRVSLGFGLSWQRLQAELTSRVNYGAVVAQGIQQLVGAGQLQPATLGLIPLYQGVEGGLAVRGHDSDYGFNLGALFDIGDRTRLGIAYRSSIEYTVEGSARFTPPASTPEPNVGPAIIASLSAPGARLSTDRASVELEVPSSATVSLVHSLTDQLDLLADVAWTEWSSVQELRILRANGQEPLVTPEHWEDTMRYAVGATYELNDTWTLRGGLGYDENPVPDEMRTARLPDTARKWVALGLRWQNEALTVDAGYAHLFSSDVPMNQDDGSVQSFGLLSGDQESAIDIVSVQLGYRF